MKPAPVERFHISSIATARLACDVRAARETRHMTVRELASTIGISESALRRIENGTSRNCRGETLFAILAWAGTRGYRTFAGFSITQGWARWAARIAPLPSTRAPQPDA